MSFIRKKTIRRMKNFYKIRLCFVLLILSCGIITAQNSDRTPSSKRVKERVLDRTLKGAYYRSEIKKPPRGVKLFEDFESHEDFSLTFGDWVMVDKDDDVTFSYSGIDFPHEEEKLAFMVMNPLTVTPPLTDWFAHSGNKFGVALSCYNKPNDDWMISPIINCDGDDVLSFYAQSYSVGFGLEKFQVLISETGSTDPDDFVKISEGEHIKPPAGVWTKYQYDLYDYAGKNVRFAIRCVSTYAMLLMIDDIQVASTPTEPSSDLNFNVFNADTIRTGNTFGSGDIYTIQNNEGGNLVINDIEILDIKKGAGDEFITTTVGDISETAFTTTFNKDDVNIPRHGTYNFGFNYNPVSAGRDSVAFILKTNSFDGLNDTIFLVGQAYDLPEKTVEVGLSKDVNIRTPMANLFSYSLSQTIYTKEELAVGDGRKIEKIQLRYKGEDASYHNVRIFATLTDKVEFYDKTDWVDLTGQVPVFDSKVFLPTGVNWLTFNFERPFVYDGTKSIVFTIQEYSDYMIPYRGDKSNGFYVSESASQNGVDNMVMSLAKFSDEKVIDYNNIPSASDSYKKRANIRIFFDENTDQAEALINPSVLRWDNLKSGLEDAINVTLFNPGTQDLVVNNITTETAIPVEFSETSFTVAPGATKVITATFKPIVGGVFNTKVNIDCNYANVEQLTINAVSYTAGHLYEDFEDATVFKFPPEGWTIQGNSGNWELGHYSANAYEKGQFAFSDPGNDYLISPQLVVEKGDKFSFHAMAQGIMIDGGKMLYAYWSKDLKNWHSFPLVQLEPTFLKRYKKFEFEFPEDAYGKTYVAFWRQGDVGEVFLDLIKGPKIFTHGNDLFVSEMIGQDLPVIGVDNEYTITVKNIGSNQINSYKVQLIDENDNVLVELDGAPIGPDTKKDITLTWRPSDKNASTVRGRVVSVEDENTDNNTSKAIRVFIQKEFSLVGGNEPSEKFGSFPIHAGAEISFCQSVYTKEELKHGGYITGIALRNNFSDNYNERRIFIYISETENQNLQDGWIDIKDQKLVYDKRINIPSGLNTVFVPFTKPYLYTGKNVVITIYRVYDSNFLYSKFSFRAKYDIENKGRSRTYFGDKLNFKMDALPENTLENGVAEMRFVFDTENCGELHGKVYIDGTNPKQVLSLVNIQIPALGFTTQTDNDGKYVLKYIPEGDKDIEVRSLLIEDKDITATVVARNETELDIPVDNRPMVTISGKLIPSFDPSSPLDGASVYLEGVGLKYEVTSDASGNFSMPTVLANYDYTLHVNKEGFDEYTKVVSVVTDDIDLGTITINEIAYQAVLPLVKKNESNEAVVEWYAPGAIKEKEFRYDDGTPRHFVGYNLRPNGYLGSAFHSSSYVKSVKWWLTLSGIPHTKVNIKILGLDNTGKPNRDDLLYEAYDIPNTDDQWNEHVLSDPIWAPNGFFVGINAGMNTQDLAGDDGVDKPYECKRNRFWGTPDITDPNTEWSEFGTADHYPYNFMVRAVGLSNKDITYADDSRNGAATRARTGYTVRRGLIDDIDNVDSWTVITPAEITENSVTDTDWSTLAQGVYKYAVYAHYDNGVVSEPAFSNSIQKDMYTTFTANVTVNTDEDTPVGTVITLVNHDGLHKHIYEATIDEINGTITVENVWKGIYKLKIAKEGFFVYADDNLDMSTEGKTLNVDLEEIINKPFNLEVINKEGNKATMTWGDVDVPLFEHFENRESFSENIGNWTSLDLDGGDTYGLSVCNYPGEGEPHGFYVFAPNETTPSIFLYVPELAPFKGAKSAVSFSGDTPSNDWLISPKFMVGTNTIFSFWAKSADPFYGLERFRVLVSETGQEPEDFKLISEGEYVEPDKFYSMYEYDLSAYAGKEISVAINCVSESSFAFLVDNIYIGLKKDQMSRQFKGYNVYFEDMTTPVQTGVTDHEFMFENLVHDKTYTVGVSNQYTSGESDIIKTTFTYEVVGNVAPIINSTPVTEITEGKKYEYVLSVEDNNNDKLSYDLESAPAWLELVEDGDQFKIVGKPENEHIGDHKIKWTVSDSQLTDSQEYTLTVKEFKLVDDITDAEISKATVYPNPATDYIRISGANGCIVKITGLSGKVLESFTVTSDNYNRALDLNSGCYIVNVSNGSAVKNIKLTIN